MIVLDTDTISNLMRPQPSPKLTDRLAQIPVDEQATTAITMGELAYGAHKAGRLDLYGRAIQLIGGVHILDFDRHAGEQYGRMRAELEQQGQRLADPDLRIAAVTLAHQGTLVTGNLKHFARISDLSVEDWINHHG